MAKRDSRSSSRDKKNEAFSKGLAEHLFRNVVSNIAQFAQEENKKGNTGVDLDKDVMPLFLLTRKNVVALFDDAMKDTGSFARMIARLFEQGSDENEDEKPVSAVGLASPGNHVSPVGEFLLWKRLPSEPAAPEAGRPIWGEPWEEIADIATAALPKALAKALTALPPPARFLLGRIPLPFCQGGTLWHLWVAGEEGAEGADAFVLTVEIGNAVSVKFLDWTNEQIYDLNDKQVFRFASAPKAYMRCFFRIVRGQLGSFLILEDEADMEQLIAWKRNVSAEAIAKDEERIRRHLHPVERRKLTAQGEVVFRASILFKNALFASDIVLSPNGQLRLENEELQEEDLNVDFYSPPAISQQE